MLPEGVVPERFEVVANLIDLDRRRRLRVRLQVPAADPVAPSLFDLWPGTEAMERETYDMFGIRFDNHPDLTRILMPEEWIGHPLRKDDDEARIPVQFKGTLMVSLDLRFALISLDCASSLALPSALMGDYKDGPT